MKLIDALKNVIKTNENSSSVDPEDLFHAVGLQYDWGSWEAFNKRVSAYWIVRWNCTDTWVGLQALYLDDELIGAMSQNARKNDKIISFVSVDMADKFRNFCVSLMQEEERHYDLIDLNEEINPTYSVDYNDMLVDDEGFFKNRPCKYIRAQRTRGCYLDTKITIQFKDGDQETIEIPVYLFVIPIKVGEKV